MPRYFIDVRYVGFPFCGWQRQLTGISIQEILEEKLSILLKTPITAVGSGRTDAGVHAYKQVVHFDFSGGLTSKFIYQINGMLPKEVAVQNLRIARNPETHARYQAVWREYTYYVSRIKDPLMIGRSWPYTQPLDLPLMQELGILLTQHTDFAALSKYNPDIKSTICQVHFAYWETSPEIWTFRIRANRFLWGMVRTIVGLMLEVGRKKITLDAATAIISTKNRCNAPMAAPACGLYLTDIEYPAESFIPISK